MNQYYEIIDTGMMYAMAKLYVASCEYMHEA